jgi:hypothetical protein
MDNPEILETLPNVYLLPTVCPVSCVPNVASVLDCPFLIVPSVFSNVYLLPIVCPVSCVTTVSSISGFTVGSK